MPTPIAYTSLGMNVSHWRYTFNAIVPDVTQPLGCKLADPWPGEQVHRLIQIYGQFSHVRVMNWTAQLYEGGNHTWADRASMDDFDDTYNGDGWQDTGLPLEAIILFANACGKPISWTFPQQCNQDYMYQAGVLFATYYEPSLLWVEGPNEIWNGKRDWWYSRDGAGKEVVYERYARDCAIKWVSFGQGFNSVNRTALGLQPCAFKRYIGAQTANQWVLESNLVPALSENEWDGFFIASYFGDKNTLPGQYISGHSGSYTNMIEDLEQHKAYADSLYSGRGKLMGIYEGGQSINWQQPNFNLIDSADVRNRAVLTFNRGRDLGLYPMFYYSGVGDRLADAVYANNWPVYWQETWIAGEGTDARTDRDYTVEAPVVFDLGFPTLDTVQYSDETADTTKPLIVSAAVSGAYNRIVLQMSEAVQGSTGFSLATLAGPVEITSVVSAGTVITITAGRNLNQSETVTLTYADGDIVDNAPSPNYMTNVSVPVNVSAAQSNEAPFVSNMYVEDEGDTLVVSFNENVDGTTAGWSMTVNGSSETIGAVTVSEDAFYFQSMGVTINAGDVVRVSYDAGTGDSADFQDYPLVSFSDYLVDTTNGYTTGDTTPPTLSTAVLGGAGDDEITLTFDEDITGTGVFDLTTDGPHLTIKVVTITGDTVVLEVGRAIYTDETVTVDYTPGDVTDLAGNALAAIADQAVNVSAGATPVTDVTAPSFVSAVMAFLDEVQTLSIEFDEVVVNNTGFTLEVNGVAFALSNPANGARTIAFTVAKPVYNSDTVTLSYTAGDVEDAAGNALGTLTDEEVDVSAMGASAGPVVLNYVDFEPEGSYDPGGDVEAMPYANTSMDNWIADYKGVRLRRSGKNIIGLWAEFTYDLEDAITQFRIDNDEVGQSTTISNTRCDRRIACDANGYFYTVVRVGTGTTPEHFMCLSLDSGRSWSAHRIDTVDQFVMMEFNDNQRRRNHVPPGLLLFNNATTVLKAILPVRSGGTLTFDNVVTVTQFARIAIDHTGGGNSILIDEKNGKAIVGFPSSIPTVSGIGTTQYVAVIDIASGTVESTTWLGQSQYQISPDDHDKPTFTMTEDGVLHAATGAHHHNIHYRSATAPYTNWSAPVLIGGQVTHNDAGVNVGGHSYNGMCSDAEGNVHLVTRWLTKVPIVYQFAMAYNRRNADGTWRTQQEIVNPGRQYYTNFYFGFFVLYDGTLVCNSSGALFDQLVVWAPTSLDEPAAYDALWTGELPDLGGGELPVYPTTWAGPYTTQNLHGPFLLLSSDAGSTWATGNYDDVVALQTPQAASYPVLPVGRGVADTLDLCQTQLIGMVTLGDSNSVRSRGWPHGLQWAMLEKYGADTMAGSGLFSFNERDSTSSTGYTVGYSEANSGTDIRVYHPTDVNIHPMPDALRAYWDSSLDPEWGGAAINHIQPKWYTLANRTIPIGDVTDGPFQHGEAITGSISGSGTFDYISDGVMYFIHTANFATGEVITGGTSGATSTSSDAPSTITPMAFVNGQEPQLFVKSSSNPVGWPNSGGGDNVAWRVWYATFADTDFAVGGTPRFFWMRAYINAVQQKFWSTTALTSFKASDQGTAGTMLNPDPMQFDYPPDYATGGTTLAFHEVGTGYYPKALFWGEYVNTDKEAGFSLHQFYDRSGAKASNMYAYLNAMTASRVSNWLASAAHRAVELTQEPAFVNWYMFGVNDAAAAVSASSFVTDIFASIAIMDAAYSLAGVDTDRVKHVIMVSPDTTDPDDDELLRQYRVACAAQAAAHGRTQVIDLMAVTTQGELLTAGTMPAYDDVSSDFAHLEQNSSDSDNSYSVLADRVLTEFDEQPASPGSGSGTASINISISISL